MFLHKFVGSKTLFIKDISDLRSVKIFLYSFGVQIIKCFFFPAIKISLKTRLQTENVKCFLLVDERVGHDAQLLNLSALLLRQVLHGLLGVKAGPGGTVAVDLPLVLPRLQRALESLVVQEKKNQWNVKDLGTRHLSTLITSCKAVQQPSKFKKRKDSR